MNHGLAEVRRQMCWNLAGQSLLALRSLFVGQGVALAVLNVVGTALVATTLRQRASAEAKYNSSVTVIRDGVLTVRVSAVSID